MNKKLNIILLSLIILFSFQISEVFAKEDAVVTQSFKITPKISKEEFSEVYELLGKNENDWQELLNTKSVIKRRSRRSLPASTGSAKTNVDPKIEKINHKLIVSLNLENYHDNSGHKDLNIFDNSSTTLIIQQRKIDDNGNDVIVNTFKKDITSSGKIDMGTCPVYYLKNGIPTMYHYVANFKSEKYRVNLVSHYRTGEYKDNTAEYVFDFDIYQVANSTVTLKLPDGIKLKDKELDAIFTIRDDKDSTKTREQEFKLPTNQTENFTILRDDFNKQPLLDPTFDLSYLDNNYLSGIKLKNQSTDNKISLKKSDNTDETFIVNVSGDFVKGWTITLVQESSIVLDANQGKFSDGKSQKHIKLNNENKAEDASKLEEPTREGYDLLGWKRNNSSDIILQSSLSSSTFTKGEVLQAQWKKKSFKITFDSKGGSKVDGQNVEYLGKITKPNDPTRSEYKFIGWKVSGQSGFFDFNTEIKSDLILEAIWEREILPPTPPQPPTPPTPPTPPQPNPQPEPSPQPYIPEKDEDLHSGSEPHWIPVVHRQEEIEKGIHYIYIYGYEDKTIRPEGKLTRAEAVAMLLRLIGEDLSNKAKLDFVDTPSAWYNGALNAAMKKKLLICDGNKLRPNDPITRGEFAYALSKVDSMNDVKSPYMDIRGHVFEDAINQEYGNGRIKGYPDGTFKPDNNLTRAEAATLLNNFAKRKVTKSGLIYVKDKVKVFPDIDESHWAYYEIVEAGHTHRYERPSHTLDETWIEILE